jgi:hypothetical protein
MNTSPTSEETHSTEAQEISTPSAEEASTSYPDQASVKLKLPPKPVLASSPSSDDISSTIQEPPTIPAISTSPEIVPPLKQEKSIQESHVDRAAKKRFALGLPLTFLLFLIALISLLIQVRFFLK